MIAFAAAAAGAFGGPLVGLILVALASLLFVAYLTPIGERLGVIATPRVRFLGAEVTGLRPMPRSWSGESGRFVYVLLANEKGPDVEVFADLYFTTLDGEPLFDRHFRARWSNFEAPPLMPIGRELTMLDLRSEEIAESLDVVVRPSEGADPACYVFNNESWHAGRRDEFRVDADEFFVHVEVRGKAVREQSVWYVWRRLVPEVWRADQS
jgi:hypothetical protein